MSKRAKEQIDALIQEFGLRELPYRIYYDDETVTDYEEFVIQQAEWVVEDYECTWGGHPLHDELVHAKWLLKRTEDGNRIPISSVTFRPLPGFTPSDIADARAIIADLKNTKAFLRELKKGA